MSEQLAPVRVRTRPSPPALSDYLSRPACAAELGVSLGTLSAWYSDGYGPPVTVIGKRHYYRRAALAEWLAAQERARA